jgi:hypothetical protein
MCVQVREKRLQNKCVRESGFSQTHPRIEDDDDHETAKGPYRSTDYRWPEVRVPEDGRIRIIDRRQENDLELE